MCPQSLRCPSCGGDNLHQVRVEAGFRLVEDEADSLVMTLNRAGCAVKKAAIADRRDDLRIFFACEQCNSDNTEWSGVSRENLAELRIHQHKGTTYCEWVAWCGPVRTGFVELDDNLA